MEKRRVLAVAFGLIVSLSGGLRSQAQESLGQSAALLAEPGPHWMWIGDAVLHRAVIVDGDDGRFLGQVPGGNGIIAPHRSRDGREIYQAETYFARGTRGARSDLVSVRDARTLAVLAEIEIPGKRSEHVSWVDGSALSDDVRVLAVFNLNPATSLSIVDLAERRFAGEIETPGCALVYGAGARRFFSLCADGSALVVTLDDRGALAERAKTERFFDPSADPLIDKGERGGNEWIFASFEGVVHPIDVSGPALRFAPTWRLTDDADREASWRIGGMQPLALHAPSGRLYALLHQGGADSHKQPGTEVWVYDLAKRARERRVVLRNPAAAFVLERSGQALGGVFDWLLQSALPNHGIERIAVTQGASAQLFAATQFPPTLAIYDATSGTHLRDVPEIGIATNLVQPFQE
jgi:methylamine dehydrogenase heavy chain